MVSSPAYDPNGEADTSLDGVYLNRCTGATFTPGSVFKLVTLAAALDTIPDLETRRFTCHQTLEMDGGTIRWHRLARRTDHRAGPGQLLQLCFWGAGPGAGARGAGGVRPGPGRGRVPYPGRGFHRRWAVPPGGGRYGGSGLVRHRPIRGSGHPLRYGPVVRRHRQRRAGTGTNPSPGPGQRPDPAAVSGGGGNAGGLYEL